MSHQCFKNSSNRWNIISSIAFVNVGRPLCGCRVLNPGRPGRGSDNAEVGPYGFQIMYPNWFSEDPVCATALEVGHIIWKYVAGHATNENVCATQLFTDVLHSVRAVHHWHLKVYEQDVVRIVFLKRLLHSINGLLPILCLIALMSSVCEQSGQQLSVHRRIINYKDPKRIVSWG